MKTLKPIEIAEDLSVAPKQVYGFIRCGDLNAINVGPNDDNPRWRVRLEDYERFKKSRSSSARSEVTS